MPLYSQISTFFVSASQEAKDGNSGLSPAFPLRSIREALSRVASLRRVGVDQPITIRLAAGEYDLDAPLMFDENVYAVTLEGDAAGETLISGGRRITGWKPDTFNGVGCLSAEIADCNWKFTDLYINGRRAVLPRYPEEGCLYPEDVEVHSTRLGDGSHWFIAQEGDIRDFRNFEDCLISFNHYWIDEHTPIAAYDPATRKVTMAYRSRFSIYGGPETSSGLAYVIENVAEMFGKPNEWYFDRPAGKIYYVPSDASVTSDTLAAYAPVASQLTVVHTHDVHFRRLTFAYTRGEYASRGWTSPDAEAEPCASDAQSVCNADGVLHFSHARDCSVEDCTVRNVGWHAVLIGEATSGIRVEDTTVFDGGMGGVRMCGAPAAGDPALACTHSTVTRCSLNTLGRRYLAACGVLIMHASYCEVSHCDIGDLFYTGVSVGWVWGYAPSAAHHNRVLCNHIHDLGQGRLSDMGGVYLLGKQEGTVVRGNVIHGVRSAHYGGWALYTDEGSSYMTLENNICWDVSENCYHQHYGSMNTVRNNIFAYAGKSAVCVTRAEEHLSIIFTGNLFLLDGKPAYTLQDRHVEEGTVAAYGNIVVDPSPVHVSLRSGKTLTLSEAQASGFDRELRSVPNPFADVANHDFRIIRPVDGFVPIPYPRTGPHCDTEESEV